MSSYEWSEPLPGQRGRFSGSPPKTLLLPCAGGVLTVELMAVSQDAKGLYFLCGLPVTDGGIFNFLIFKEHQHVIESMYIVSYIDFYVSLILLNFIIQFPKWEFFISALMKCFLRVLILHGFFSFLCGGSQDSGSRWPFPRLAGRVPQLVRNRALAEGKKSAQHMQPPVFRTGTSQVVPDCKFHVKLDWV